MRSTIGVLFIAAATLAASLALPSPAFAQDELRVRQLENDVRQLQRQVEMQNQRIDRLETNARAPGAGSVPPPLDIGPRAADSSPAWLVSTNWDKLHTGMKELDVIALLGRPTSVRNDESGKTHTMFYAMELGPNAFLTGTVRFGDAGVAEINRPTLR
jgi:hypothetical protein